MEEMNFNDWFLNLERDKKQFWNNNQKNKVVNIEGIVDNLHGNIFQFIFELIQNADDTNATEASFHFYDKKIIFTHNGKEFTRKNIQSITSVGFSDKKDDEASIGKFGLGFKSVYNIAQIPEIYSSAEKKELNFRISNYIIPEKISKIDLFVKKQPRNNKTFFVFNLNQNLPNNFSAECNKLIKKDGFKYLLFLNNLKKISINIFKNKIEFIKQSSKNNIIKISQLFNKKKIYKKFFIYRHKLSIKKKANAYIIFAYPIGDRNNFYRTPLPTKLHIFLETQENTGLNFYLHAPFIPNNSRTEIDLFKDINNKILSECSSAFIKSIVELKKLRILNLSFISILPDSLKPENEKFLSLHQTIQNTLQNEEVWECNKNKYQKATKVVYWGDKGNNIFSDYDLKEITKGVKTNWLKQVNLKENSTLLEHFNNNDITYKTADILNFFAENKNHKLINDYLFNKSLKWLYDLYKLLSDNYKNYSGLFIIKTNNDDFKSGNEVKFLNKKINLKSYSTVNNKFFDKKIFSLRKINFFKNFFKDCGVTEINKEDEIKDILVQNFNKNNNLKLNEYVNIMNHLMDYYKKTKNYSIFENYNIFLSKHNNLQKVENLFLDEQKLYPTYLNSLKKLYPKCLASLPYNLHNKIKMIIPKNIQDKESYISIAIELGIMKLIPMGSRNLPFRNHHHPLHEKIIYSYGELSLYYDLTGRKHLDEEYEIVSLESLLNIIEIYKEKKISYLIANRLKHTDRNERIAKYRPKAYTKTTKLPASFIYELMDFPWIPQKNGSFKKTQDSNFSSTDKTFLKILGINKKSDINNSDLLKELDFSRIQSSVLERKEQISFAKKNNILPELIEFIIDKSPEEQKKIIHSYNSAINLDIKQNKKPQHPGQGSEEGERSEDTENETDIVDNKSDKKLSLTKNADNKLQKIKNTLKEKHYLSHCQICCLSDLSSSNGDENTLVKKLGRINRKKLMDVHHIYSKESGGDVYKISNMLVLCRKHHLTFAKQLGYSKKTLKDLVMKLVNNKQIVKIKLPREDGSIEEVQGYKIKTNKDLFEVFFTKPHCDKIIKDNQS